MLLVVAFVGLGAVLEVRYAKTRKLGHLLMGLFFDALGVWWTLRTFNAPRAAANWSLTIALALGAAGLLSDALNIGGERR